MRIKGSSQVSVVIPTHNRADMLPRAIRSVLTQTVQDFEIIVVDDASTDDVKAVVQSFGDARIILVRHEACRGGSAARNTGIVSARGEFVAFLDDDDEWLPKKLELQLLRMAADDKPGMVYTGALHIGQQSGSVHKVFRPVDSPDLLGRLLKENVIETTSSVMIRRVCLGRGIRFDESLKSCQDWDFYLKVVKQCSVACIGTPLVRHYEHPSRISKNYESVMQGHHDLYRKIETHFSCTRSVRAYHHFRIGKLALQFGDTLTARQQFLLSLRYSPWAGRFFLYLLASFMNGGIYQKGSSLFQRLKSRIAHMRVRSAHG